jgi:hypothetical protein
MVVSLMITAKAVMATVSRVMSRGRVLARIGKMQMDREQGNLLLAIPKSGRK